jgi:hypothetical protein
VKKNYYDNPKKVIENYHEVELTVADDGTTMPTMTAVAEQTSLRVPQKENEG